MDFSYVDTFQLYKYKWPWPCFDVIVNFNKLANLMLQG